MRKVEGGEKKPPKLKLLLAGKLATGEKAKGRRFGERGMVK